MLKTKRSFPPHSCLGKKYHLSLMKEDICLPLRRKSGLVTPLGLSRLLWWSWFALAHAPQELYKMARGFSLSPVLFSKTSLKNLDKDSLMCTPR